VPLSLADDVPDDAVTAPTVFESTLFDSIVAVAKADTERPRSMFPGEAGQPKQK
jgi:hypothetical protein